MLILKIYILKLHLLEVFILKIIILKVLVLELLCIRPTYISSIDANMYSKIYLQFFSILEIVLYNTR